MVKSRQLDGSLFSFCHRFHCLSTCFKGVTVAGACISKTLAKASVAPIAETKWGYMGALWYEGIWQVLSLLAGIIYVR